jgi:hypothetical protein
MSDNYFACPACGYTDGFTAVFTTEAWSTVDYIDADTGRIQWGGTSDSDWGVIEDRGYECNECEHKFTKDAFDPALRIAKAVADLDALFDDEDDDEVEILAVAPRPLPTIEVDFLAQLLRGDDD